MDLNSDSDSDSGLDATRTGDVVEEGWVVVVVDPPAAAAALKNIVPVMVQSVWVEGRKVAVVGACCCLP